MIGGRFNGIFILVSYLLSTATAQTTTLNIPTGLPASCTTLATLLSEYPPPPDGEVLDKALSNAVDAYVSTFEAARTPLAPITLCNYIISTHIPSASPSVTSALSSYVSAAGIWLEDHPDAADLLLYGHCSDLVLAEDKVAVGDLQAALGSGQCYKLLGWDQKAPSNPGATTTDATTTTASSTSTSTPSRSGPTGTIPSPTSQPTETTAPPNAGGKREGDLFWILATVMCVTLFYL